MGLLLYDIVKMVICLHPALMYVTNDLKPLENYNKSMEQTTIMVLTNSKLNLSYFFHLSALSD